MNQKEKWIIDSINISYDYCGNTGIIRNEKNKLVLSLRIISKELFIVVIDRRNFNYFVPAGLNRLNKKIFNLFDDFYKNEILKTLIKLDNEKIISINQNFKNSDLYFSLLLDIAV